MSPYANTILTLCAIAVVALLSGCATVLDEDKALTRVPYALQADGRLVIEVRINKRGPFRFAVDSAASISAVSGRLMRELNLTPEPSQRVFVHGAIASGEFGLVELASLAYGTEQQLRKKVVVLPGASRSLRGLDGLLGLDILRDYSVGFAAREKTLALYAPGLIRATAYRNWSSVPLVQRLVGDTGAFVYSIDIEIRGYRIPAILDLGAEVNVVNNVAARRFGLRLNKKNRGEFVGALDSAPILANLTIASVMTRSVHWTDEDFSVIDLPVFKRFGFAGTPAAIVGANLLNQRDFIIDFPRSRLLIRSAMPEQPVTH